jgi:hypothetical protein
MQTSCCAPESIDERENEMLRTAFPWFGLCLWGAVLAYCFLVAAGP